MREIRFRGMSLNGNWVYGDLVRIPKDAGDYNNPPSSELTTYITNSLVLTHEWVEVDPDSVVEFSGLPDKSGTPIYEGDIVSYGGKFNHEVKYEELEGNDGQLTIGYDFAAPSTKSIEVIGNVHQHPHLLNK